MMVAEALYPNYSISQNYISDLGATCRSGPCVIHQPTSIIFNSSVSLLGLSVVVGAIFIWRAFKDKVLTPLMVVAGAGVLGVGLFPETAGVIHFAVSAIAFSFGGASAIAAYRIGSAPFTYLSITLGTIALVALVVFFLGQYSSLGPGGMERMIAYPEVLFAIGFGGYLMGRK